MIIQCLETIAINPGTTTSSTVGTTAIAITESMIATVVLKVHTSIATL